MDQKLSEGSLSKNYYTAAAVGAFLGLGSWGFLLAPQSWLIYCLALPLAGIILYRSLQYELTLRGDELVIVRVFSKPRFYPAQECLGFKAEGKLLHLLLIQFNDGQRFAFFPKLRTDAIALRSVPVAGFVAYWTERLREPAHFEGQVWPDDVI